MGEVRCDRCGSDEFTDRAEASRITPDALLCSGCQFEEALYWLNRMEPNRDYLRIGITHQDQWFAEVTTGFNPMVRVICDGPFCAVLRRLYLAAVPRKEKEESDG